MYTSVRHAIDYIYCAPGQDKQHSFKLVTLNKRGIPVKGSVKAYGVMKHLPNNSSRFIVFTLGNLPPVILNLKKQKEHWYKDVWINVAEDMVARDYILKVYNQDGLMYPRGHIYYSFIDENSILVALEILPNSPLRHDVTDFCYLNTYTNAYFGTAEHNSRPVRIGIDYKSEVVVTNLDKLTLQQYVAERRSHGGDVYIYLNGYHTQEVRLEIEPGTLVEIVYDQSVFAKETISISSLTTFISKLDHRNKLFIYRDRVVDHIQFMDDIEVYIATSNSYVNKGLHYYKHKDFSLRNVTDKDFSIDSMYVSNTVHRLNELLQPGVDDKKLVLYYRKSGRVRTMVYSALKLHELYKLPIEVQSNTLNNTGPSINQFRVEELEASDYFKVCSSVGIKDISNELAMSASGYNGIAHFYANTPVFSSTANSVFEVPELYQGQSIAFEHDANGKLLSYGNSYGAYITPVNAATKSINFIYGYTPNNFGRLYNNTETVELIHPKDEIAVLSAYFYGASRDSAWEDITNNTSKVTRIGNTLVLNEVPDKKVKIVYYSQVNIYTESVTLTTGVIRFPIKQLEDRGSGYMLYNAEAIYRNIGVYLNGNYLTEGIEYRIDYPYITIIGKKHIDYSLVNQEVVVRCSGYTTNVNEINELNVVGFINNGALMRNKRYDLRDDRVMGVYIGGKVKDRATLVYSEDDNTVRINSAYNGLPYTVEENFIELKPLIGLDTTYYYTKNKLLSKEISGLYDTVHPEPSMDAFNVIGERCYLYSPVISSLINNIKEGVIPESTYNPRYNDGTIFTLIDTYYKELYKVDPIKLSLPEDIVEIHPHLGNAVIDLKLPAYKFVMDVIRVISNNKPARINTSGYLRVIA